MTNDEELSLGDEAQPDWRAAVIKQLEKLVIDETIIEEMTKIVKENSRSFKNGKSRLPVVRSKSDMVELETLNALNLSQRDRVTEILLTYSQIQQIVEALHAWANAKLVDGNPEYAALKNEKLRQAYVESRLHFIVKKKLIVEKILSVASIVQGSCTATDFAVQRQSEMGAVILSQRSA